MADELSLELEEGRKRQRKVEPRPKDGGPMLFAALAIILLSFFILLSSQATPDSKKRIVALGSLMGSFGSLGGGLTIFSGDQPGSGGPLVERKRFVSSLTMFQQLVKARGFEKEASIQGNRTGFTISLSGKILFEPGQSTLKPKNYIVLNMIKFLIADSQKKFRFRVEGHTDPDPVQSERFSSNWDLSLARAVAVLRYIIQDTGIDGKNLSVAGFAHFRPRYDNKITEERIKNRRVEIVFVLREKPRDVDPRKGIKIEGFQFSF